MVANSTTDFKISKEDAIKYLSIYVGHADWPSNIDRLYSRLSKKNGKDSAAQLMRKTLSCTILLPSYDRTVIPDSPENLLYWVSTYHQFNERDWVSLMQETMSKDKQIAQWRNQCQALGVVHPVEFSPITRQALNWLMQSAKDSGVVDDENKANIKQLYERLVMTYGGTVICNIFDSHKHKVRKMVLNWRTNYFFEHLIFDTYTAENVIKIKKNELKKTNPTLVKSINN